MGKGKTPEYKIDDEFIDQPDFLRHDHDNSPQSIDRQKQDIQKLPSGQTVPAGPGSAPTAAPERDGAARPDRPGRVRRLCALLLPALLALGLLACSIVDLAINGSFTWSRIPMASALLVCAVTLPALLLPRRGLLWALTAAALLTYPFLYILHLIIGDGGAVLSIGLFASCAGLLYLWLAFLLLVKIQNKWTACALLLLLAIPLHMAVNLYLHGSIGEPLCDVWDMMTFAVLLAAAGLLYGAGRSRNQKRKEAEDGRI
ncbi:MAG: hypothetical protein HFE86_01720 [Clostridiales bacterium]|nr:hypothetical protein [Clostridiales bacterium]